MNTPKNTELRGDPLISAARLPESWFTAESEPPPVITEAHRDDLFAVAATLRAEVEKNVLAAVQSQTDALSGLLKLEALFGPPPTQTAPPSASGWRSMASAPRDGREVLVRVDCCNWIASFQKDHWFIDEDFGHCDEVDMEAWAPIPEWTGEVAE